jgi:hypothetical protein
MEEKKSYVYRHIRLDTNEVFYIGKGTKKKQKTFRKKSTEFERAYKKEGRSIYWENVTKNTTYSTEILADGLSNEDALELEVFLISIYKRKDCCGGSLVNFTDGGEGVLGTICSKETKKKISKGNKGKIISQEVRDRISKSLKGKKLSEETKNKISKAKKGLKRSREFCEKMKKITLGKKASKETKDKMSKAKKGTKHPLATKVLCILDGIFYETIKEACIAYNLNYKTTYRRLKYNKINNSILILV